MPADDQVDLTSGPALDSGKELVGVPRSDDPRDLCHIAEVRLALCEQPVNSRIVPDASGYADPPAGRGLRVSEVLHAELKERAVAARQVEPSSVYLDQMGEDRKHSLSLCV